MDSAVFSSRAECHRSVGQRVFKVLGDPHEEGLQSRVVGLQATGDDQRGVVVSADRRDGLASRPGKLADNGLQPAPGPALSPCLGRDAGLGTACIRLEDRAVARRYSRDDAVAIRGAARASGSPGCGTKRTAATGVAPDPLAARRRGTDEVLVVHGTGGRLPPGVGRSVFDSVAHRAGPRRDEGGAGIGPLRGTELAWLPPSRHPMHIGVRVPRRRARSVPPPQRPLPSSSPLRYPKVSARGEPPVRVERHVGASITTMRMQQARQLAQTLPCCPWCGTAARAAFLRHCSTRNCESSRSRTPRNTHSAPSGHRVPGVDGQVDEDLGELTAVRLPA